MTGQPLRFVHLNSGDLENLIEERNSVNTTRVINSSVAILKTFCDETGRNITELYSNSKAELRDVLKLFYGGLRNSDGEIYAKRSMISIRYGLQKHFMKKRQLDIVNDLDFKEANNVFLAVCAKIKKEGKSAVVHKEPVTRQDLQKLYTSFNLETSEGLQNKVFVDYMLYFCNRGRENLRELKISDFAKGNDDGGRRFIYLARDHATKNHRNDEKQSQGGRMYELRDNPLCPYTSFVSYIDKLHQDFDVLWQRPNKGKELKYDKMALGKNTLGNKMKNLSKQAGLSKVYTNHCLRATSITELDRSGFEARHIMSISGHQSESSIRSYSSHVDDTKKLDMAMSISRAITGDSCLGIYQS
jgi:integrase